MRAKQVPRKAVCFDFDDTLVKTKCKTHVIKNGRRIKSLSPAQAYDYEKAPDEELDESDWTDPRIILAATKYKMWPALESIYSARKQGRSNQDIYILTAREPICKDPIWIYLKRNGIILPDDNVICVGTGDHENQNIADDKKKVLQSLKDNYDSVLFYDDSKSNIKLAGQIGGVETMLVD